LKIRKIRQKIDNDRYLLTFADLVTLLLGLFVILYSFSAVDEKKFEQMQKALSEVFKSGPKPLLEGGAGVLDGSESVLPKPEILTLSSGSLDAIEKKIESNLLKLLEETEVSVFKEGNALKLELPEKLLFDVGSAELKTAGKNFIDSLSILLKEIPNEISVDGHTDTDPISSEKFESNLHLSAFRAANVASRIKKSGMPTGNLLIRGFGEERPRHSNSKNKGKNKNRRVEISIFEIGEKTPIKS